MSNNEGLIEIYRWVDEARRASGEADIIQTIEARIRSESDDGTLRVLNFSLASELKAQGKYGESERIYLMLFDQNPNEPAPLISLAEQKLYYEEQLTVAMEIIDRALAAAFRSTNFRRHALGVKARVLLKLQKYDAIESILRQLMELRIEPGSVDIGIERDFFDRLPAGSIDEELARQFDQYSRSPTQAGNR